MGTCVFTVKCIQLFGMIDIFYSKMLGIENISLSSTNPPGASRHTENKIRSNYFWLGGPAQYRVWLPLWLPGSHSDPSGFFPGTGGSSLFWALPKPTVVSGLSHPRLPLQSMLPLRVLFAWLPTSLHPWLPVCSVAPPPRALPGPLVNLSPLRFDAASFFIALNTTR